MDMDGAATDEAVVFLSNVKALQDPRQPGKIGYPLDEILLLCLLAVLAGAECFTEIALLGVKKLGLLCLIRPFKMVRPPTIIWATSWPRSTPSSSKPASSPGSRR